ncbi:hypothetical protein DVJ83_18935 (plasmid) [Deinococcus wulumuqiensis]|uniref:Uncharacterized protein n=1 Tax=Deinococcus wulumuqiensis TaxID=980427 RepID=A0A345IND5_9DEIO|nr:hypothetical protein DVJ83_18935 [Deinococcus wulumuqiensis]
MQNQSVSTWPYFLKAAFCLVHRGVKSMQEKFKKLLCQVASSQRQEIKLTLHIVLLNVRLNLAELV